VHKDTNSSHDNRQEVPETPTRYAFETVDVFTRTRFGGNPLCVFVKADGLTAMEMQRLASELNLSETAFVLPPEDTGNTARVRIFNRTAEMPFAGHPNVGTAFVLGRQGNVPGDVLRFEELAGIVEVQLTRSADGIVTGATIRSPQPLHLGPEIPVAEVAACAGLTSDDVVLRHHPPIWASVGNPYVVVEVTTWGLAEARPDITAFRRAAAGRPEWNGRYSLHLYARQGNVLRARMFAPLAGTFEDPATGSANAPLAGLLLSLSGAEREEYTILQGVEMGRPSTLHVTAWRERGAIQTTIRGACVPVLSGMAYV
jgi:trans-2,3-dihydro-3-hydroxyanthranilate isomerase